MERPESILIIKLSAIGDVVHALPLLESLRSNFPAARIDWLVEEEASQIVLGHPALDRVIVSRRKRWLRRPARPAALRDAFREAAQLLKEVRANRYDWVIDLQGLLKSGVLTGLSRGRRKLGLDGAREGGWLFFKERPVPVDYDQHAIERYLTLVDFLGCRRIPWQGAIPLSQRDEAAVDDLLERSGLSGGALVALNPMARWKTKLWGPERFAELADAVRRELGCEIAVTGSPADRALADEIVGRMTTRGVSLAGRTTLKELAGLFDRCRAVVATDTGPMHIAAAMGCPTVALFGPTAPWRTGPYGDRHRVVREELICSPCFRKQCDHPRCMERIRVESVLEALRETLAPPPAPG